MIVGYMDASGSCICVACWPSREGQRANGVLIDDRDDPNDNFWIVDDCERCGRAVKYIDVQLLD